jgi:hypothetical protein
VLRFDPDPAEVYRRLRKDDARSELFRQVRDVCAQLDNDHGQAQLRRHRFAAPPLRYVTVRDRSETWVILWEEWPSDPADAVVRFLGPASFA